MYSLLDRTGTLDRRAQRAGFRPPAVEITGTEGCSNELTGNGQTNTRVTQDCSLRAQAGEQIAVNPLDPDNILVGQNDARTGYNRCGYAWTLDGGTHWGDDTPPFSQVPLLDNHAGEACSDPTVTWDSQGNAYITSTVFRVGAPENAVVVAKSNPGHPRRLLPLSRLVRRLPGIPRDAHGRGQQRGRRVPGQALRRCGCEHDEPEARLGVRDLDAHRPRGGGLSRRRAPDLSDHVQPVRRRRRDLVRADRDQRRGRRRLPERVQPRPRLAPGRRVRTGRSTRRSRTTTQSTGARRS